MDINFCVDWDERTLKFDVKTNTGKAEFVLFLDNFEGQVAQRCRVTVKEMIEIPWYDVPDATDILYGSQYIVVMLQH